MFQRENSVNLVGVIENAVNSALEIFLNDMRNRPNEEAESVQLLLAKRMREEILLVDGQLPHQAHVQITAKKNKSREIFYLKCRITVNDFEDDEICVTKVIGFPCQKEKQLN